MTTLTRADWEQRAKDLKIEGRAYHQWRIHRRSFRRHVRVPQPSRWPPADHGCQL
jgi:hypothetical protein